MENNNQKLLDDFKLNIAISNFEKDLKNEEENVAPKFRKNWRKYFMKKRWIIAVCGSLILVSGVVLAKNIDNIKNYFKGLDKGIQRAAEEGYIADTNMDYIESNGIIDDEGEVIDNIKIDAKIENFMMDDVNLNMEFNFLLDEKIKEKIDLDKLHNITLKDLIIRDEENRILYAGPDEQAFNDYCKENNLNYIFGETNENYMNCNLQYFPTYHEKNSNFVKLTYNLNTDTFPKSKKLYFSFGKIKLEEEITKKTITLIGNWNIELDVPEKMYNRTSQYYKVISVDNKDFEVYASKVTDTGFEIGTIISNIKKPEQPFSLKEIGEKAEKYNKEYNETGIISEEAREFKNKYIEWIYNESPIQVSKNNEYKLIGKEIQPAYVENSDGEKFYCTLSPGRKANGNFIDGNKYDFYDTFSMTKYDATDNIRVILFDYGTPVTIELEKIK